MKEILTGIKEEVPRFVNHYYKTLTAPRTYPLEIIRKRQKQESSIAAALIFFILCIMLSMVFLAPIFGLTESWGWARLSYSIIIDCVLLVLAAGALRLAWRPFGGTVTYQTYLILFSYIFGTVLVAYHFINLVGLSILNRYEPAYYRYVVDDFYLNANTPAPFDDVLSHGAVIAYTLIGLFMLVFCLTWFYLSWATFRKANVKSRTQGIGAALIFTAILAVMWYVITLISPLFTNR